ncbi:hypothetical protein E1B28_005548 [Marasmius oreades]|uniref:Uncharacterized protein n=1 Tax=Marasmius oreades TaxID=181124 RepID=A0A9P7UW67_9AGAR|nr:uncharacterized protein E1B28_005548 [Marasmius oreades]KAG7094729.1 hypothetical protein E1B28_005548 [Marasmius oreades]
MGLYETLPSLKIVCVLQPDSYAREGQYLYLARRHYASKLLRKPLRTVQGLLKGLLKKLLSTSRHIRGRRENPLKRIVFNIPPRQLGNAAGECAVKLIEMRTHRYLQCCRAHPPWRETQSSKNGKKYTLDGNETPSCDVLRDDNLSGPFPSAYFCNRLTNPQC